MVEAHDQAICALLESTPSVAAGASALRTVALAGQLRIILSLGNPGYWPTSPVEPFASHINRVPKYVVSTSLDAVPWGDRNNATLVKGDLASAIKKLKGQPGKNIGVHGSPMLVESLLQADLLDELRLEIYPVIAGSGERLFRDGRAPKHLQLADGKITGNGVVILTYQIGKKA